ncbi:MAG TPA: hypothetical protein VN703_03370 [Candidatus Sulfopaludibacter sp.]|nr:hypothetical protein [Candidatus Sulfopaludibacter sp.]
MTFSNIDSDGYNNTDFGNIIILKKVRSLRQLRRTEKELVKLCYKEAIIKGFTLKGIQQYIASKSKIWIEWFCLEQLKKTEEQENREWFYYMARDHFAYVGAYRKCIDEIAQYKKEVWNMVIDSKTDHSIRIQALKELHSLSKTYTLLIKDIPFVTNISKCYDKDVLSSNYNDQSLHNNHIDEPYYQKNKFAKDQFDCADLEDSHITDNLNSSDKYENHEENFEKAIRAQLKYNTVTPISKEHLESIRKLKELEGD